MNPIPVIASGVPQPSAVGIFFVALLILVAKPATYFLFIRAFRYRVSQGSAMTVGDVVKATAVRVMVGGIIVTMSMAALGSQLEWYQLWIPLTLERMAIWGLLGILMARLRGRALMRFAITGAFIDLAYDVVIVGSLFPKDPLSALAFYLFFLIVLAFFMFRVFRKHPSDASPTRSSEAQDEGT